MKHWNRLAELDWHERNRGLVIALGACLVIWMAAILFLLAR